MAPWFAERGNFNMSNKKIVIENSEPGPEPMVDELAKSMEDKPLTDEKETTEVVEHTLQEVSKGEGIELDGKFYTRGQVEALLRANTKTVHPLPSGDEPAKEGHMLLANLHLKLNQLGTSVPLTKVTPAEVMFLASEHAAESGGNPVKDLEIVGEVKRSDSDELNRLREKYNNTKLAKMFAGAIPQLPKSFKQAVEVGIRTKLPGSKLMTMELATGE